jgi:predicted dinucleotide-binding enzyme
LNGKVLVDASNRVNPADPGSTLDGTSAAFATRQANPDVNGIATDGFVAGDDPAAKAAVLDLVGSIGFRPIDAGPLAMARALEGMALLNITYQIRNQGTWLAGWRLVEPSA